VIVCVTVFTRVGHWLGLDIWLLEGLAMADKDLSKVGLGNVLPLLLTDAGSVCAKAYVRSVIMYITRVGLDSNRVQPVFNFYIDTQV
jgi:hypothetical protein